MRKLRKAPIQYCVTLFLALTISGCSSGSKKKDQIISIQKRRIQILESQLRKKSMEIEKQKVCHWMEAGSEQIDMGSLKKWIQKKDWPQALRESHRLKEIYPKSPELSSYRYKIFMEMGLEEQAIRERQILRQLRASKSHKGG